MTTEQTDTADTAQKEVALAEAEVQRVRDLVEARHRRYCAGELARLLAQGGQ